MRISFLLLVATLGLGSVSARASGGIRTFDDPKAILAKGPVEFACLSRRAPLSALAPRPLRFRLELVGATTHAGDYRTPVEVSQIHLGKALPLRGSIVGTLLEKNAAEQNLFAAGVFEVAPYVAARGLRRIAIEVRWEAKSKALTAKVTETLETEHQIYSGPLPALGATERRLLTLSHDVYLCDLQ